MTVSGKRLAVCMDHVDYPRPLWRSPLGDHAHGTQMSALVLIHAGKPVHTSSSDLFITSSLVIFPSSPCPLNQATAHESVYTALPVISAKWQVLFMEFCPLGEILITTVAQGVLQKGCSATSVCFQQEEPIMQKPL